MRSEMMVPANRIRQASEILRRFSMDTMLFGSAAIDENSSLQWLRY